MNTFFYELKEGLVIAFTAVKANKIRTLLTTLGIVIGVTSVVLMSTAIKGICRMGSSWLRAVVEWTIRCA